MVRRVLLIVMAAVASFALSAFSGYVIYTLSTGRSEAKLSLLVRFVFNPAIALLVGGLVGILSKDHPASISLVGLVPWAVIVHGSRGAGAISGLVAWLVPVVIYLVLGAVAALFTYRFGHQGKVNRPSVTAS